jgi:methionyl-tRNA formyltransferase
VGGTGSSPPVRTVYLGTSSFAAAVLRRLAQSPHRPQLVVTRPDRPRGRGRRLAAPPVADTARELGIELYQPESVNGDEARARIAAAEPQTVIVCAFGALIREPLLSDYPTLNVHPSLLPRWRGAAPVERAIMAGDERTGVSIMRLTAGLDSGPVCLTAAEAIGPQDTYGTLAERLQGLGGELLIRALDRQPACAEQDEAGATYAEKITAEDRLLRGDRPAIQSERVVRALSPHIGAAVMTDGDQRLGVWEAVPRPAREGDPPAGELGLDGAVPVLGCSDGVLELTVVQPAGRRAMAGDAFLRGQRG